MEGAQTQAQPGGLGRGPSGWLGAAVGLVCFVATLLLALLLRQGEERALAEATTTVLRSTASEISRHLNADGDPAWRPAFGEVLRDLAPGYAIRVLQGDLELWRGGPDDVDPRDRRRLDIPLRGVVWTAEVTPGPAVAAMYRSRFLLVLAVGGALFGLAIGWSLQLSRTWRWRSESLRREMAARARAEAAERTLREELSSVLSSLPDHLWSAHWHPETGFQMRYSSPGTDRISGRDRATFERDPGRWAEAIHPDDRKDVMRAYRAFFAGEHDQLSLEYRLLRPDGGVRWVRDRVRATPDKGGRRLDGILSDITRLKRDEAERIALEASVQQSRRLESLGVLAGGIAHDFNNLLVGVLGHARLTLKELPEDSPLRSSLLSIEKSARRAAELCRQLLAYAGQGHFEVELVDLREVAQEMEELLGTWLSSKVDLRHDFAHPLPAVEADPSQARQLVMNLITNASEAIGDGRGSIHLSLRPSTLDRAALGTLDFAEGAEPGEYVALTVSDDGEGMDEETRQHLFEPFYTTKFAGRGLGMAAVLGITRTHRGGLRVESEPGRGTTVTVLLPASHRVLEPSPQEPARDERWRGRGMVLLVDDDEDARELGGIVLERAGFSVLPAASGLEALRLFERRGDEIRCVLLDLTMPGLDGAETLRRLRDRGSEVPVVLFSGYREATAVERFKGLGLAAFLEKPFTPESLVDAVRRALGEG